MNLRIATLNVWALPPPIGHRVAERMTLIGKELAALDLDVIAFQEVWTEEARGILKNAGHRCGLNHSWHRPRALGGSGLLLLSRHPLREPRFERYLLGGLPQALDELDYYGGKGFVHVRIESAAGAFSLVSTHLQARYGSRNSHEYRGHRAGQIVQLASALRPIDEPLLLLGDFNIRPYQPGYEVLRGLTGVRDLADDFGNAEATVVPENPYRTSRRPRRVDYVFARSGESTHWKTHSVSRVFDTFFGSGERAEAFSDHAGIAVELRLAPGVGPFVGGIEPDTTRGAQIALAEGRERALHRARNQHGRSAAAIGVAALSAVALRNRAIGRRRFLRTALQGAALVALAPSALGSTLAEVWSPGEVRAFDLLDRELAYLAATAPRHHLDDGIEGGVASVASVATPLLSR